MIIVEINKHLHANIQKNELFHENAKLEDA